MNTVARRLIQSEPEQLLQTCVFLCLWRQLILNWIRSAGVYPNTPTAHAVQMQWYSAESGTTFQVLSNCEWSGDNTHEDWSWHMMWSTTYTCKWPLHVCAPDWWCNVQFLSHHMVRFTFWAVIVHSCYFLMNWLYAEKAAFQTCFINPGICASRVWLVYTELLNDG